MAFPTDSIEELVICVAVVFFFWLIMSYVGGAIISFILWDISNNNGINLLIFGLIIIGIIMLVFFLNSKESKPAREEYHTLNANELSKFHKKCSKCGNPIVRENTKFCPNCGSRLK